MDNQYHIELSIKATLLDSVTNPIKCYDGAIFEYLTVLPGQIYRQVKNRQTKMIPFGGKKYVVKLHQGICWKECFKNILKCRLPVFGAANEWNAILCCKKKGILTTPLVCYGKWGKLKWQRSFVMTKLLDKQCSLEELGYVWQKEKPGFALKRQVICTLAKIARVFHAQGMNHRDFYLCHFLVPQAILSTRMPLSDLPMHVIDLHRVQMRSQVPRRCLIKDISALLFSSMDFGLTYKDYLYFIKHYTNDKLSIALMDRLFWEKVIVRAKKLYYKENKKHPNLPF